MVNVHVAICNDQFDRKEPNLHVKFDINLKSKRYANVKNEFKPVVDKKIKSINDKKSRYLNEEDVLYMYLLANIFMLNKLPITPNNMIKMNDKNFVILLESKSIIFKFDFALNYFLLFK